MAIDVKLFRTVMGRFATGVTVVTSVADGRLHGLTANSVTGLSLDPTLLLVCVDREANAHAQLTACTGFTVNILGQDQEELSNGFAKSTQPQEGSLGGAAFQYGETGAPRLEGAMAWIDCRVVDSAAGGDHTIFIGQAEAVASGNDASPLLYFSGGYRRLA